VEPHLFDLPEDYRRSHSPYAQYYDGKISFADEHFLAPLIAELSDLGRLDDTIVVLWSDHGEDLHEIEHGHSWGHNWNLSEPVMRTLLVLRGPGVPQGIRHEGIAQSIDIFPTLAELAGILPLPQFEGKSLIRDGDAPTDTVYMENLCQGFAAVRLGRYKLILSERERAKAGTWSWKKTLMRKTLGQVMPASLKRFRGRLRRSDVSIWCQAKGEPEEVIQRLLEKGNANLYDLVADPGEHHNLADLQPETVAELKQCLRESANRTAPSSEVSMSDQDREQLEDRLRGLGYL
jgi:arylsulfatase A-like enzyme